jgi:protein-L-isoaspartate(D-aspartate) O-methyltransferase
MAMKTPPEPEAEAARLADRRSQMVERQLADRGITDERVLQAMREVPRHEFVPPSMRNLAYDDGALRVHVSGAPGDTL